MGLSSFNRMRRSKVEVDKAEAERFKKWNETHNATRQARDETSGRAGNDRKEEIRQLEAEANKAIGEKVIAGMESAVIDEPLRKDHAAEIAGRNLEGVQTPKDPVERVEERIPQHETANEQLVPHMQVNMPGPDLEQLNAAREEVGVKTVEETPAGARQRTEEENAAITEQATLQAKQDRLRQSELDRGGAVETQVETPVAADTRVEAPLDETQRSRAEKARSETPDERSRVRIPKDWSDLPASRMRSLAAQLTDEPVKTKADAEAVISAEVERRKTS
jgi:hypothetical protein